MNSKPLRVAIVTPYYDTPDKYILQCYESVVNQTYPCSHILVADGKPQNCVTTMNVQHVILPTNHRDHGDTPRAVGSTVAIGQGFDAIAYLDADNWYYPDHIQTMVDLHLQTGAAIVTTQRDYYHLDGSYLAHCLSSDGNQFCDTSCYFLTRAAFPITLAWVMMEPDEHPLCDRVMWYYIKRSGLSRAHNPRSTVAYRATHAEVYRDLEVPVPPEARESDVFAAALQRWVSKGKPPLTVKWYYKR